MDVVVFVPGTMGSILKTPAGEEVWPPTALETQFGYKRKAELMRPDLQVGDVIRKVLCFGVYRSLIEQLAEIGFKEGGTQKRLKLFPYDWRKDIESTADLLAKELAQLSANGATSITIVAHSMGGLVARLLLESGKHQSEPWFTKIGGLLALATPHLGAPLALARVLGMDSALGISAEDFRQLAGDVRYPSGYQLLPAPAEAACWNIASEELDPLDIYDPAVAQRLGLNPALLARASFVHETLAKGNQPAHVRYFYFAGTGHKTATRINIGKTSREITISEDAGDGTVPLWSALPKSGQKQLVVGEHASFFTGNLFKPVFYRLLGHDYPVPPVGLAASLDLSVHSISIKKIDQIELLLVPTEPVREIKGTIVLERTDDPSQPFAPFQAPLTISFEGPPTPQIRLMLDPTNQSGLFQVRFVGQPASSGPVQFAATEQ